MAPATGASAIAIATGSHQGRPADSVVLDSALKFRSLARTTSSRRVTHPIWKGSGSGWTPALAVRIPHHHAPLRVLSRLDEPVNSLSDDLVIVSADFQSLLRCATGYVSEVDFNLSGLAVGAFNCLTAERSLLSAQRSRSIRG